MANALYDLARQAFLSQTPVLDWDTDNIKCALLNSGYSPNLATDQYVSTIAAYVVARSGNLAGKTVTAGVADAADITFTAVSGVQVTRVAIYKDAGADATSPLIALIDTATGLPVTPNGGDITIAWDNGANKIFRL